MSKNANGQGTLKKRANGTWEGQYCVWEDGKLKRRSVYGKTQAEARKKLSAVTNDLDNGVYLKPQQLTVSEWFDTWEAEYLIDIKPSTKSQYDYQGRIWIKPKIGSYALQKITAPVIQRFYNDCSVKLSPKSIKNLHGVLHRCFNQAVLCGYLRSNPCEAVVLPRIEKKEMKVIQGDKVSDFLAAIKSDVYGNLYFVDVFTGMRESEIIGLTWDCIDFTNGLIRVEKQFRKNHGLAGEAYCFTSTKNSQKRVIKPAPAVMDVLRAEKLKQTENKLKYGSSFDNPLNLVFTNEIGEHLKSVTVYNHVKGILKSIGLESVRFHDLRHTYATLSIENGDDLKTVSENLGHATVAFTADVYQHVTDRMKANSADRMQEYIQKISG